MESADVTELLSFLCPNLINETQCNLTLLCKVPNARDMFVQIHHNLKTGPKLEPPSSYLFTYAYIIVFIVGLVGNILTIFVISKTPRLHSRTNYFLCNLAASDTILLLVGVPTDVMSIWMPNQAAWCSAFCMTKSIILSISTNASIFTILGLTLERFIAICYPLHLTSLVNPYRMSTYIAYIWALATVPAVVMNSQFRFVPETEPFCGQIVPNMGICDVPSENRIPHLTLIYLIAVFFLPMLLIFYWYGRILCALNASIGRSVLRGKPQSQSSIPMTSLPTPLPVRPRQVAYDDQLQTSTDNSAICEFPVSDMNTQQHEQQDFNRELNNLAESTPAVTRARQTSSVMYVHHHPELARTRSQEAQHMVVKMLVVVTVVFFVCYLPVHIQRLLNQSLKCVDGNDQMDCNQRLYQALHIVWALTGVLHFMSAAVNPIVYNLMSERFRAAFQYWIGELLLSKSSSVRLND